MPFFTFITDFFSNSCLTQHSRSFIVAFWILRIKIGVVVQYKTNMTMHRYK